VSWPLRDIFSVDPASNLEIPFETKSTSSVIFIGFSIEYLNSVISEPWGKYGNRTPEFKPKAAPPPTYGRSRLLRGAKMKKSVRQLVDIFSFFVVKCQIVQ
jgi:hypothetical protein